MHHAPNPPVVYSFPTKGALITSLAEFVVKAQRDAISKKGKFTVALSGGSLPSMLGGLIGNTQVKWDVWQVFYADERVVPLDHPDSNDNACTKALFSKVSIPAENIHAIDPTLLDDLEELTDAYEQDLIREFAMKDSARFPVFDLILLGMGPDGHTASLFPDHPLLLESGRWVAPIEDSPKPPPKRITLTLPAINHAVRVVFVAVGKEKKVALKAVLDSPDKEGAKLPASKVKPVFPGELFWFVDDETFEGVDYLKRPFQLQA